MPPEYYLGAAVAVILLILLVAFSMGNRNRRRAAQRNISGNAAARHDDELTTQLKRIADSLEVVVAHLQVSPGVAKQVTPEPTRTIEETSSESAPTAAPDTPQPSRPHVKLSMFGR